MMSKKANLTSYEYKNHHKHEVIDHHNEKQQRN